MTRDFVSRHLYVTFGGVQWYNIKIFLSFQKYVGLVVSGNLEISLSAE